MRSKKEQWEGLRQEAAAKTRTLSVQRTAEAAANTATKQEQARQLAIDVIVANLGKLKEMQGSRITTRMTDKKGNPVTVDFSLNDMVSALERLQRMSGYNPDEKPVQVIIDV